MTSQHHTPQSIAARTMDLTKVYGKGDAEVRALDGVTVAISNVSHARELEGKVLDYDGPGYLIARSAVAH